MMTAYALLTLVQVQKMDASLVDQDEIDRHVNWLLSRRVGDESGKFDLHKSLNGIEVQEISDAYIMYALSNAKKMTPSNYIPEFHNLIEDKNSSSPYTTALKAMIFHRSG